MTSEAPNRPGQEPGETSSGAGGPAPYGDRPAQQDNGYRGAPDLGWAPPPPAGHPAPSAPAWGAPDDQPPAWTPPGGQTAGRATAQVPPPAEGWGGPAQPAWAAQEQGAPAWAAGPPAPPTEQPPAAWGAGPSSASAEPGPPAWGATPGGPAWAAAPPAGTHGEQPAWAQSGDGGARGAASVPAPATPPHEAWATGPQGDDPARSDGWPAAAGPQDDRAGGWAAGTAAQQHDDPNRSGGWGAAPQEEQPAWGQQGEQAAPAWAPAEPAARAAAKVSVSGAQADNAWPAQDDPVRSGGWETGAATPHHDDPDRSGGWAAGRAAEAGQQPGWGSAAVPTPGDRPDSGAWPSAEAPARASASVTPPDSPSAWGGNQDNPAPWTPEQPAIPDAQPWAPGEAWGRATETQPGEPPIYQPAPGPGISPANAVPLPPQEQRVPGAALAASPPGDYLPPAQFAPADRDPYEPEQSGGWGAPEPPHNDPQSPAGPMVPGPRTSPEAGGHVSASASVPVASRVTPPADQALHTGGVPAPQPRVYGRPSRPEPEDAPGSDDFPEPGPRFDEHGPQSRTDEPDRPNGFAEAPPVPFGPPSSPAGPPPFPPGMPSFSNPSGNTRPVNGVHPQSDEHSGGAQDLYGGPGGHHDPFGGTGPSDPFGGPGGQHDPFGGTPGGPGGSHDPYGGQFSGPGDPYGAPGGGRAAVAVPGSGPMGEPGPGGFPPPFPPPPQQAPPAWQPGPANQPDQGRFDAFKPEAEPQTEAPTPKVRNGRVLAVVLIVAVLILAIPLGTLKLLGKLGGDNEPAAFNPAVGSCVKQAGTNGVAAVDCGEQGAFKVLAKVDAKEKCGDPAQPHVVLPGDGADRVLCLKPAAAGQ
ncbi:hypothetical protein ONA91_04425 [Micromonospora sp. DR5-3]|uniref:LppU/SCO3897 family protein n=1 Tax=unclassified Micromonospora TaxID=2617518 RepID=UPI0011DAE81A|nr:MULTISPECIES: hypothetical protein [unclassified Micromonospora]MCW3813704.1 hypothetical protein [Micromonospora sp. DR5-3]TYC25601.1 hypothetical protein FXF52_04050 [Micromonospora sp. MP36]